MDLANLDLSKNAEIEAVLHVVHPITLEDLFDDNNNPVTITLLGMESSIAKRIGKARSQKQLNSRKNKQDLDEIRAFGISLMAKLTVASSGFKENGIEVNLGDNDEAVRVYSQYSWLRDQVDEFIMDRANFYKA